MTSFSVFSFAICRMRLGDLVYTPGRKDRDLLKTERELTCIYWFFILLLLYPFNFTFHLLACGFFLKFLIDSSTFLFTLKYSANSVTHNLARPSVRPRLVNYATDCSYLKMVMIKVYKPSYMNLSCALFPFILFVQMTALRHTGQQRKTNNKKQKQILYPT